MNAPFTPPPATVEPFRFTVDQFLGLDDEGFFGDHAKTELLEGEIFVVNAQYRPHARAKAAMVRALEAALGGSQWTVLTELTVRLSEHDAPEPDIVLTNEPEGDGPVPAPSVGLLVEICDTTHATDLNTKPRRYARAGVPEYWVVDLPAREIVRHSKPSTADYAKIDRITFGETIVAVTIPGVEITSGGLE